MNVLANRHEFTSGPVEPDNFGRVGSQGVTDHTRALTVSRWPMRGISNWGHQMQRKVYTRTPIGPGQRLKAPNRRPRRRLLRTGPGSDFHDFLYIGYCISWPSKL